MLSFPVIVHGRKPLHFFLLRSVLLGCLLILSPAAMQAQTWTATVSGNWSSGGNWNLGTPPISGTFGGTAFGGTTAYTATEDIPAMILNVLAFRNSGAVTIATSGSGSLTLGGLNPNLSIANASGAVTFSAPLTITTTSNAWITNDGGTLTLGAITNDSGGLILGGTGTINAGGAISGSGGLVMNGNGTLTLSGANSYSGGSVVTRGVLRFNSATALPSTGTLTANSGGTMAFGFALNQATLSKFTPDSTGVVALAISSASNLDFGAGNLTSASLGAVGGTLTTPIDFTGTLTPGAGLFRLGGGGGVLRLTQPLAGDTNSLVIDRNGTTAGSIILNSFSTYQGSTTINAGTLRLSFASLADTGLNTVANVINPNSALVVGGGTLNLFGKSSGTTDSNQTFSSLTVNSGASAITATLNGAQGLNLVLHGITRNVGGTIDFQTTGLGTGSIMTTTENANYTSINGAATILGGYATIGGAAWAVSNTTGGAPGAITALSSFDSGFNVGTDVDAPTGSSGIASQALTINSLRFSTAGSTTLTITDTLTIASGGILVTSTVGNNALTFTGGNLTTGVINSSTGARNDLVVHQNTTGSMTIASAITGNVRLTKSGTGALILTNPSNALAGATINAGTLQITGGATAGTILSGDVSNNGTLGLIGGTAGVTYGGVISGTGSVLNNGNGVVQLTGVNSTYTGSTTISTTGGVLVVSKLSNGGQPSSIGASSNAAANLVLDTNSAALALKYVGAGDATDRLFTINISGIDASGTGPLQFTNGGTLQISGTAAKSLTLTGTNTDDNLLTPRLIDALGSTSLNKSGSGTWVVAGLNTFTNPTQLNHGILKVSFLADAGLPSNIGMGSSAASLNFNGGTLQYTGPAVSTNRLFTIGTSGLPGVIDASGTGPLTFSNIGPIIVTGARNLTLTGSSSGANTFRPLLPDFSSTAFSSLTKSGSGAWVLGSFQQYSGATTVNGGTLFVPGTASIGNGVGTLTVSSPNTGAGSDVVLALSNGYQFVSSLAGTIAVPTSGTNTAVIQMKGAAINVLAVNQTTATTFAGNLSGSNATLVMASTSSSTLTLTGAVAHAGGSIINSGTLALAQAAAGMPLGSHSSPLLFNAGALQVIPGTTALTTNVGVVTVAGGATMSISSTASTPVTTLTIDTLVRSGTGTLLFSSGGSGGVLGTNSIVQFTNAPALPNGILDPWAVANSTGGSTTNTNFVTISSGKLAVPAYATNLNTASATAVVNSGAVALSADKTVYALRLSGALTLGSNVLTLGANTAARPAGLILVSSGAISGGPATGGLAFGTSEGVIFSAGSGFTISSVISGSNGLTYHANGSGGILTLSGANVYTGPTTVNSGTVIITSVADSGMASSLGAAMADANNLVLRSGTTLQYTGSTASSTNRLFTLGAGTTTLNASGSSGAPVSFTGVATIVLLGAGPRTFTLTGTNSDDNKLTPVLSDGSGGPTSLTKAGTGTWVLGGANSYTGTTSVSAGVLSVLAGASLGSGALAVNGTSVVNLNGSQAIGNLSGATGASINMLSSGTLTVAQTAPGTTTGTYSGLLTGSLGSLILTTVPGSTGGTLFLNRTNNTYGAGTTINAGLLLGLANSNTSENTPFGTGPVLVRSGALQLSGATATGPAVASIGELTTAGGAYVQFTSATATTQPVTLKLPSVTRSGTGTLIFNPASSVLSSSATNGKVLVQFTGTLPSVVNTIVSPWMIGMLSAGGNNGEFLTLASEFLTPATYSAHTLANAVAGDVIFQQAAITVSIPTSAYALRTITAANITLGTSGTLTLGDGANPAGLILNNITISGGPSAGGLFFGASEGVVYVGNVNTIGATIIGTSGMTVFGTTAGGGVLNLTNTANAYGDTNLNSNTIAVTSNSNLGPDVQNSVPVSLNFAGGTLSISGLAPFSTSKKVTLGSGADILDITNPAGATFSGVVSGTGIWTKTGVGALTLTGANTLSGGINVNQGALLALNTSGSATGTGFVYLANTTTLAGTGRVVPGTDKTVTINPGARIRGGVKDGTNNLAALTVGNLTFLHGGILQTEVSWSGTNGANASRIDLTAASKFAMPGTGVLTIELISDGPGDQPLLDGETYLITLAQTSANGLFLIDGQPQTANGSPIALNNYALFAPTISISSSSLFIDATGTQLQLSFTVGLTPAPEPTHILLTGALMALLGTQSGSKWRSRTRAPKA